MAEKRRRKWWRFLLLALTGAMGLSAVAAGVALYWLVAVMPGPAIRPENIERILAVESPVYYRDGSTVLGVFFRDQHRQYVPYQRIPKTFIDAIVAAEDQHFFDHHGIDLAGIGRAMLVNLKAGRIVQGGSTLTQQTAKNLFKRQGRTLRDKLKELLYALRLEYHYSKEEILEFYVNQFYVSGNGHGLAVAARYFFDKRVEDLDLVECAFIAGSVKRPNAYNPFIQRTEAAERRARQRAAARTAYVLARMRELGMIDQATYEAARRRPVPFRKGTMTYAANVLMDQLRQALALPVVEEALAEHGIDNIATSGVRIVTTVDAGLQQRALEALRLELSRLEIRLTGYSRAQVAADYAAGRGQRTTPPAAGDFRWGTVTAITEVDGLPQVEVDLGEGERGIIDYLGLRQVLVPLVRYHRHRWVTAGRDDLALLLAEIKEGDPVYLHLRARDQATNRWLLDLQRYPEIQGGLLVQRNGRILAMVGGYENRDFNRAVQARRTMGSVFKPILYAAALQLGWNPADLLVNRRDVFVHHGQAYYPRPDHPVEHDRVSMAWAGVTSENVASVWLLYHLCDRLTPAQFDEVARRVGVGLAAGESRAAFRRRVRDELGIVVDDHALRRAAFHVAVKEVAADLAFEGEEEQVAALERLHYAIPPTDEPHAARNTPAARREAAVRAAIARYDFQRLLAARTAMLEGTVGWYRRGLRLACFLAPPPAESGWQRLATPESFPEPSQVWVEGILTADLVDRLAAAVDRAYHRLAGLDPYSPEVLRQVHDYRLLVGIRYLIGFCRALGMESDLEPVLSFPLGSNVITLEEAARAYEGLMAGAVTRIQGDGGALALIDRIENADGQVVFQPERFQRRVLPETVAAAVSDILANVVRHGTGRKAASGVELHSDDPGLEEYLAAMDLAVPAYGKTGTANRFTNAAFVGGIPGPGTAEALVEANGYQIAAYVGYDDNRPMVRGTTHITGSGGALPLWIRVANALIRAEDLAATLDVVDFSFNGLTAVPVVRRSAGLVPVPVDPEAGGVPLADWWRIPPEDAEAVVLAPGEAGDPPRLSRIFHPYWRVE